MNNLAWVFLTFLIGSVTAIKLTSNEIDLSEVLGNLPEDLLTRAHQFLDEDVLSNVLADPTRFITRMLPKLNPVERKKRFSDRTNLEWDIDYELESLNTNIKMNLDNINKPLEGLTAVITIDELNQILETKYHSAKFEIEIKPKQAVRKELKIKYTFKYKSFLIGEQGTFTIDYSPNLNDETIIQNKHDLIHYNNVATIPEFYLTKNPKPKPKEPCHQGDDDNNNKRESRTPCPFKMCQAQDEMEEMEVDKETLLSGELTGSDNKKYKIKFGNMKDLSELCNWSQRRYSHENFISSYKNSSPKIDGIIKVSNGKFYDILIGYREEDKQAKMIIIDGDTSYVVSTRLRKERTYFTIKTLGGNSNSKLVHTEYKITKPTNPWELIAYYESETTARPIDAKISYTTNVNYKDLDISFKINPNQFPLLCNVFRFCKVYHLQNTLKIHTPFRIDFNTVFKKDNHQIWNMAVNTMQEPYILNVKSSKFLPIILPNRLEKFEVEIVKDGDILSISRSNLEELQAWTANNTDNGWKIYQDNVEVCTVKVELNDKSAEISTSVPDQSNTKITTTLSRTTDEWNSNQIKLVTQSTKRKEKIIRWDISDLKNIFFSGTEFESFQKVRELKLLMNSARHYLEFKKEKNLQRKEYVVNKDPLEIKIYDN